MSGSGRQPCNLAALFLHGAQGHQVHDRSDRSGANPLRQEGKGAYGPMSDGAPGIALGGVPIETLPLKRLRPSLPAVPLKAVLLNEIELEKSRTEDALSTPTLLLLMLE